MKEGENIADKEGEKWVGVGWFDLSGESTTSHHVTTFRLAAQSS